MFDKKRKQKKISIGPEEAILRLLRNIEIVKLLSETQIIKEKDLIFDWMNDIDINEDFKLWKREIDGDCFNSDKGEL